MSPESIQSFIEMGLGFAVAGLLATGYQAITRRPATFSLLRRGPSPSALAAVPFLIFAAPFVIMRTTLRLRHHFAYRRFEAVMIAGVVSGFWSLMSGTLVAMALTSLI